MQNKKKLSLYIPQPEQRPGDIPDFSKIVIPPPGNVPRPDSAVAAHDIRDIAFKLIRVLDNDGKAVGPWNPRLDPETLKRGLRLMMLTRAYDDRMYRAQRQGKTSFYMKCTGEEAVSIAPALALDPGDMCFPSYRQQGLLLTRGYPMVDMMCQVYSNVRDPLKGRQLPIMYSSKAHGFFTISGNLGTQFSQAVGWAMASAYKGDVGLSRAGDPQCRQQSMGDFELPGHRRRRAGNIRCARHRLWRAGLARRRQRFPRGLCCHAMGGGACAQQSRRHADRALYLSCRRPLHERRSKPLSAHG
jgi:2-oxoisovalerate dehydrogenase E1 component alpha subunit